MRLSVPVRVLDAIYKCNRVALCDSVSVPYILWYIVADGLHFREFFSFQ